MATIQRKLLSFQNSPKKSHHQSRFSSLFTLLFKLLKCSIIFTIKDGEGMKRGDVLPFRAKRYFILGALTGCLQFPNMKGGRAIRSRKMAPAGLAGYFDRAALRDQIYGSL